MFERPRGKLSIVSAVTDFTRFGAWSHQVSANAVSFPVRPRRTRAMTAAGSSGAFAYSPLDPTAAYTSAIEPPVPGARRGWQCRGDLRRRDGRGAGRPVLQGRGRGHRLLGSDDRHGQQDPGHDQRPRRNRNRRHAADRALRDRQRGQRGPGHCIDVGSLTWTANIETDEGVVKFSSSDSVRVAPGGLGDIAFKPAYDNQLRFRLFVSIPINYLFGTDGNNYVVLHGSTSDHYGALTLESVRQSGATRTPTTADRAQFELDQAMLRMPKWVITGPTTNTSTSSSNASPTWIFVFADGSMLQYGNQHGSTATLNNPTLVAWFRRAIGVDPNKNPSSLYATDISGDPTLSANNGEYLFTRPGSADARGYPTGGGANGIGHPGMSPSELYAAHLEEGRYINIGVGESTVALASELEGIFVGQDADGPLGIIGNWILTGDAFGVGETRGPIRGAFGADFQP